MPDQFAKTQATSADAPFARVHDGERADGQCNECEQPGKLQIKCAPTQNCEGSGANPKDEQIHVSGVGDISRSATAAVLKINLLQKQQYCEIMHGHSSSPSPDDAMVLPPRSSLRPARKRVKSLRRRNQCRINQARYREKQRTSYEQLEADGYRMRREIEDLKRRRQDILLSEKNNLSSWTIVAEVFRIVENTLRSPWRLESEVDLLDHAETRRGMDFLQNAFASHVSIGELRGFHVLMEKLRHHSVTFGDPRFHLHRIQAMVPGVVSAAGKFTGIVTNLTLQYVFPLLRTRVGDDKYISLHKWLQGRHLDCNFSVDFFFDKETGRVVRLEAKLDLMIALLRVLGSLRDVSVVCESALFL